MYYVIKLSFFVIILVSELVPTLFCPQNQVF